MLRSSLTDPRRPVAPRLGRSLRSRERTDSGNVAGSGFQHLMRVRNLVLTVSRIGLSGVLVLSFLSTAVQADLPSPRFDRLRPLGAAAGTEVEAEVQGNDIEGVDRLLFDHPGLSAVPVEGKERTFRIVVAADVPEGTYDGYLVGRFGVSNPRLFAITHGLTDIPDIGQNRELATAQPLEINSAVNGVADGNADDFYRFSLAAGQRVTIDCQAQRLDSELDGTLSLVSADGALLASNGDYFGKDPFIDFVAPADGDYIVGLHDLSYRGGAAYRLVISDRPQVENIYPAALQADCSSRLTALGRNFGSIGRQGSDWTIDEQPLEALEFDFAAPSVPLDLGTYTFIDHPTHHSVLPTAATCTLTGLQVTPEPLLGLWNAQPMLVTPYPVVLEAEPNDSAESPQAVALPLVAAGRFDKPRDADWFQIEPDEDASYQFDVYCERIAGRADPYVVVMDDQGNRMAEPDDYGHRVSAFDGHLRDPSQSINLNKGRKYRVLVQDRYRRGGARYQYVLRIERGPADFHAAAMHRSNPDPAGTNLYKGTATYVDVILHQRCGYNGPVTIEAEGLPQGVHFQPTVITNNSRGTFVLWADDDAPDWTGFLKLFATGVRDGETFRREVRPYSRVWNNSGTSRPQRQLALAVRERGPYDLQIDPPMITVQAGSPAALTLKLRRLWGGFTGPVTIQAHEFPGQFQLGNFDIAAGQTDVPLTIQVQQGAAPGDYTLCVKGQAQVPFNKDAAAADTPNTLVATISRPVTIRVERPAQ